MKSVDKITITTSTQAKPYVRRPSIRPRNTGGRPLFIVLCLLILIGGLVMPAKPPPVARADAPALSFHAPTDAPAPPAGLPAGRGGRGSGRGVEG